MAELEKEVTKFKKSFATKAGTPLPSNSAAALDEEDVNQEKIVKGKKK